jgi:2,3-bisphosphoglycerate-independent phosphoglycerate mutase
LELNRLREAVARFESKSGVSLGADVGRIAPWMFGDIGAAVRVVLDANAQHSRTKQDVSMLERYAENLKGIAERALSEATAMRAVLEMRDAPQETAVEPAPPQQVQAP